MVQSQTPIARWPWLVAVFAVIVLSLNEYQIFYQLHRASAQELIDIAHGVLDGHPPWRAFQARLLGPALFAAIEAFMRFVQQEAPTFYRIFEFQFSLPDTRHLVAFNAFATCMIVLINLTTFGLLLRYTGSPLRAVSGAAFGALLFVLWSDYWLYMWDYLEIICFSILTYMMFTGRTYGVAFIGLYIVTLMNRESAAFFGVWLLCLAACERLIRGRIPWGQVALGLLLIAIAATYVTMLRRALLVESTLGHELGNAKAVGAIVLGNGRHIHQVLGNHILIAENAIQFAKNLVSPRLYVDVYVVLMALHSLWLAKTGFVRRDPRLMAIGIFSLFLLLSLVSFALLNETRIYLIYVPILVFSVVTFAAEWWGRLRRIDETYSKGTVSVHPHASA